MSERFYVPQAGGGPSAVSEDYDDARDTWDEKLSTLIRAEKGRVRGYSQKQLSELEETPVYGMTDPLALAKADANADSVELLKTDQKSYLQEMNKYTDPKYQPETGLMQMLTSQILKNQNKPKQRDVERYLPQTDPEPSTTATG